VPKNKTRVEPERHMKMRPNTSVLHLKCRHFCFVALRKAISSWADEKDFRGGSGAHVGGGRSGSILESVNSLCHVVTILFRSSGPLTQLHRGLNLQTVLKLKKKIFREK